MKAITPHYIDGAFLESHGREVMEIINPTNRNVIAQVTPVDEDDARRAIAAAKRGVRHVWPFNEGGARRRFCAGCTRSSRRESTILTTAMVEEYGGPAGFSLLAPNC